VVAGLPKLFCEKCVCAPPTYLSVYLSIYLPIYLSIYLSIKQYNSTIQVGIPVKCAAKIAAFKIYPREILHVEKPPLSYSIVLETNNHFTTQEYTHWWDVPFGVLTSVL